MNEDTPTRAELAADERTDPLEGMTPCPRHCGAYFHGLDTTAARTHVCGVLP